MNTKLLVALAGAFALTVAACEKKDGTVEKTKDDAIKAAEANKDAVKKAAEANKDAVVKNADATKDAAKKQADAIKDSADKTAEAQKDAAKKTADLAKNTWEHTRNTTFTDHSKIFADFRTQIDDLAKKADAAPAAVKDSAKKTIDDVKAKVSEGEKLVSSLKDAKETEWMAIRDKNAALVPQIKAGISSLTTMLPK